MDFFCIPTIRFLVFFYTCKKKNTMTITIEAPIAASSLTSELLEAIKPNCYEEAVKQYTSAQGVDLKENGNLDEIYEILGAVQPVNLTDYLEIRAKLNEAFKVGDLTAFAGEFAATELELGTLRHGFFTAFEDVIGKPFVGDEEVSFDLRLSWRNALIAELDQLAR